jgi:hypothetical protein
MSMAIRLTSLAGGVITSAYTTNTTVVTGEVLTVTENVGTPATTENDTSTVTTIAGALDHINVTSTSTSLNTTGDNETTFTATAKDQYGNNKSVTFAWDTVPSGVGTLNDTTGSVVNFTAAHAGRTEIYAVNSSVSSNATHRVWVTVNAITNTTQVEDGNATATSGDSTAIVKLNNESVNGTITIKELGDPLNSTTANGSTDGLGTGVELIKGVNITASANVTGALANDTNRTSWIHIKIEYNESRLGTIDENTLFIYKYVNGSGWVKLVSGSNNCTANGRNTTANYIWANVTHLCDFGVGGSAPAGSSSSSGGGGGGAYPPGWFGTLTPTVTATAPPPGERELEHVTSTSTKRPAAAKAAAPVFAIAGLLAIAYAMMRRRG